MTAPRTVSVVICAYTADRWDDVLAAAASVRDQSHPALETLVVVDHNPALLEGLGIALPDVRVIPNAHEQGLSGGRNTGIDEARGDVVAFLDDDAVAEADWLKFFLAAYTDDHVLGVGGTTLPWWQTERPRWWPQEFDWVVGCTFVGRRPGPVRNLLGGNASFRRDAFAISGGFPTHIGRTSRSTTPLGCEETELCIRMATAIPGGVFLYEDRSVIWHRVSDTRSRFRYFRTRCYAEGLSKALVTRSVGVARGLSAEREYTWGALRTGVARGLAETRRGDASGLRRAGAIVAGLGWAAAGYGIGIARAARGGPS